MKRKSYDSGFKSEAVKLAKETSITNFVNEENKLREEINDLASRIQNIAKNIGADVPVHIHLQKINIDELNVLLDVTFSEEKSKYRKFPKLSTVDTIISCTAGIIAVAIDVLLVGTPEVVKIYRGGEKFDGSIFTKAIRKLGESPLGDLCKKLETICRVPYDISILKDGMIPNNHRLRSLSHDPFFGLFFAVFDIIMNTTTFIDNSGCLRIIPNASYQTPMIEKILCVLYYSGRKKYSYKFLSEPIGEIRIYISAAVGNERKSGA